MVLQAKVFKGVLNVFAAATSTGHDAWAHTWWIAPHSGLSSSSRKTLTPCSHQANPASLAHRSMLMSSPLVMRREAVAAKAAERLQQSVDRAGQGRDEGPWYWLRRPDSARSTLRGSRKKLAAWLDAEKAVGNHLNLQLVSEHAFTSSACMCSCRPAHG